MMGGRTIRSSAPYLLLPLLLAAIALSLLPVAGARSSGGAELKIVDLGPMESTRGYKTWNADDNTFYPGDFFHVVVEAKSAGKRGIAVRDGWKRYDKEWQIGVEKPWYGVKEHVDDNEKGQWYPDKESATNEASEKLERSDVVDAGVENRCIGNSCVWRAWWVDRDWKVELLRLKPVAFVRVYNTEGGSKVKPSPDSLDLEEGKTLTENVFVELDENTDPGRYAVEVEMAPPQKGRNNPYEGVPPIVVRDYVEVVKYDPVFRQIPYLCLHWRPEATDWMIQKPNAVVTRYDGSKGENGKPALDRRTVISGLSVTGTIVKPLHASHMFQKRSGENPAFDNENVPPNNLAVDGDGHVKLARKPNGRYYEAGALISSVLEPPLLDNGAQGSPVWEKGSWEADTPDGTHVRVYARFGATVEALLDTEEWVPIDSLEDSHRMGKYAQYRAVLYTEDLSSTPVLKKVELELHNAGRLGEFTWAQKDWTGGPNHLYPKSTSERVDPKWVQGGYYTYRDPLFYHRGDTITRSNGVPRTGMVKLVPRPPVFGPAGLRSFIRFELEPAELPEGLKGKTATMESAPSISDLSLEGVVLRPGYEEVDGERVFVFARGGRGFGGHTKVRGEPSFKYDGENRYKKWRFLFYPGGARRSLYRPRVPEWFEDATVGVNVTFWFHQEVSRKDFEGETLKPAFTSALEWAPMADHQPVRVSAWELKPWAKDRAAEEPRVVLQDNAWKVDEDVRFRFKFTSMQSPENFLRAAKETANLLRGEGATVFEGTLKGYTEVGEWLENLGFSETEIPKVRGRDISSMREALLSVAVMDNEMLQMVLGDLEPEDGGPQLVQGEGSALDNVGYRAGGYFVVEENARSSSGGFENALAETVSLPFDPNRIVDFNVNLSGEGLAASVVRDAPSRAKVRVYDPPQSGGLRTVEAYDNQGNLLESKNFALPTFGWLPLLEGGNAAKNWHDFTFLKSSNSPTELILRMTNEWGATTEQTVHISRGRAPTEGAGIQMSWKWVVFGFFAMIAWMAGIRYWRDGKGR